MARASLTNQSSLRRSAGLALLLLATLACGGGTSDAQEATTARARRSAGAKVPMDPHAYLLNEAEARQVVAVMRAWTPPVPEVPQEIKQSGDIIKVFEYGLEHSFTVVAHRELTEQNSTATIDSVPALQAAIARAGLSSRQFAKALLALQTATMDVGFRDMAALQGAKHPGELFGTAKANAELVRKLTAEGAIPSGWF
jgi:hypothetical protein